MKKNNKLSTNIIIKKGKKFFLGCKIYGIHLIIFLYLLYVRLPRSQALVLVYSLRSVQIMISLQFA